MYIHTRICVHIPARALSLVSAILNKINAPNRSPNQMLIRYLNRFTTQSNVGCSTKKKTGKIPLFSSQNKHVFAPCLALHITCCLLSEQLERHEFVFQLRHKKTARHFAPVSHPIVVFKVKYPSYTGRLIFYFEDKTSSISAVLQL